MVGNILIVDDEARICSMLRRTLERSGHYIECSTDPQEGLERLKEYPFDLIISDLRMPRIDGLELLRRARAIRPQCEVVMMTAHATVATAREALKRGALDYITKPIDIDGELRPLVNTLFSTLPASEAKSGGELPLREARAARGSLEARDELEGFVGRGAVMSELLAKVRKVAAASVPVLLEGESGSGKEVIAGLIHRLSRRAKEPFVKINCAALPETLLESELFGHTKGAFTGASSDREGLFQAANGGTLLLDEIGEISRTFQPKLLRVLQEGEFHRLGDARQVIRVDVRVIAATNRDLAKAVEGGDFRRDLYYRLNVVPLVVPPLRERIEDLPDLLAHFVRQLARRAGREQNASIRFSPEAMQVMQRYPWPGNVRELANAVEYAMVLSEGEQVMPGDLPVAMQDHERLLAEDTPEPPGIVAGGRAAGTLEGIEMRCIVQAMTKTGFNRTRAASLLGVTRRTLGYRISKYGLEEALTLARKRSETASQPGLPNFDAIGASTGSEG